MHITDKIFEKTLMLHKEKQRRLTNMREAAKKRCENEAMRFSQKCAQFPLFVKEQRARSRLLDAYLKEATTTTPIPYSGMQIAQKGRKLENFMGTGTGVVVKKITHGEPLLLTQITIGHFEVTEIGFNRFLEVNEPDAQWYTLALREEFGNWTFGCYRNIGVHGVNELSPSAPPAKVRRIMERLMDPRTFLKTLFRCRPPKAPTDEGQAAA